jgi:prolyl-tRNA synthetase
MMGGSMAHEFMVLTPVGEDTLLLCDACGHAANRQIAAFRKPPVPDEAPRPLERVSTPGVTTIEALTAFLDVPPSKCAKAVFMVATRSEAGEDVETFVFAVVRGDMALNETKLANAIRAKELRPATDAEIRAAGAEPGYGSPIGVELGAKRLAVVDDAVAAAPNLVAGANEPDTHLLNVNVGRDFTPDLVTDIAAAQAGDACPECGAPMRAERGIEVGNIFKLGTRYSEAMGATYADEDGEAHPVVMGSYGIGIGRLLAAIAETHNDDDGLIWPMTVAPFPVHLITLGPEGSEAQRVADELYDALRANGVEALYDDRDRSPGIKFNDADLIGLPIRLTVARRGLEQDAVELKLRTEKQRHLIPRAEVVATVAARIGKLRGAVEAAAVEMEFRK